MQKSNLLPWLSGRICSENILVWKKSYLGRKKGISGTFFGLGLKNLSLDAFFSTRVTFFFTLGQFFLTICPDNYGNKILLKCKKNFQMPEINENKSMIKGFSLWGTCRNKREGCRVSNAKRPQNWILWWFLTAIVTAILASFNETFFSFFKKQIYYHGFHRVDLGALIFLINV